MAFGESLCGDNDGEDAVWCDMAALGWAKASVGSRFVITGVIRCPWGADWDHEEGEEGEEEEEGSVWLRGSGPGPGPLRVG